MTDANSGTTKAGSATCSSSSATINPTASQEGLPQETDPPSSSLPPGTFTFDRPGVIGFTPDRSGPDANFVEGGEIPTPAGVSGSSGALGATGASAASSEGSAQFNQILTNLQGQLQQILTGFGASGPAATASHPAQSAGRCPPGAVDDAGGPSDTSMFVDTPDDGTSNDAADLVGDWNAVTLDGESVADSDIRIGFTEEGQVSSFDGINSGGGTYEAADGDVSFGGLITTQVGTSDQAVSERADTFNEIFSGADSFVIGADGNLTLTDEDTNRTAVFEPA